MIYTTALIGYAMCGCARYVTLNTPDDEGHMQVERAKMEARELDIKEVPLKEATPRFMKDNCPIHGNHWMYQETQK